MININEKESFYAKRLQRKHEQRWIRSSNTLQTRMLYLRKLLGENADKSRGLCTRRTFRNEICRQIENAVENSTPLRSNERAENIHPVFWYTNRHTLYRLHADITPTGHHGYKFDWAHKYCMCVYACCSKKTVSIEIL